MNAASPLLALTATFWAGVGLAGLADAQVPSAPALLSLYAVCVACAAIQRRWRPLRASPRAWLAAAGYSLLLALVLRGANFGLDALHGAQRVRIDVAAGLGGLELWFVLSPGVTAVTVAAWLQAITGARAGARARPAPRSRGRPASSSAGGPGPGRPG